MTAADASVRDSARAAHAAGLCVLPPKQDGSKQPDAPTWTRYQRVPSTEAEIARWYTDGRRTGLGVVCGAVSGGLECFEFDDWATYEAFLELARAVGLGDLVDRIAAGYAERTPGGGVHWLWRCAETAGNTRLAARPLPDGRVAVLIETRGEGGYVVLAPSHGSVHPSGKPYVLRQGGAPSSTWPAASTRPIPAGRMPSRAQRAPVGSATTSTPAPTGAPSWSRRAGRSCSIAAASGTCAARARTAASRRPSTGPAATGCAFSPPPPSSRLGCTTSSAPTPPSATAAT